MIPKLIPALKALFAEELDDMKERQEKRHQREKLLMAATQGAKRDQAEEEGEAPSCSSETKRLKTS